MIGTSKTELPTTTLPTSTTTFSKLPDLFPRTTKSTFGNTRPSTSDQVHEFAWGKSKEDDEAFTFSPASTPTSTNIYIQYIKKELSQRMKSIANVTNTTPPVPSLDKTNDKFKYENPRHYIEKITAQKNKAIQPHTHIKKTHITIDEVEQHSGAGNKSDSIEKHIELDESETDIEGQNQYETETVFNDVGKTSIESMPKTLESQWGISPEQKADPWLPISVSQAAVNIAKDMDKSYKPNG